MRDTLTKAVRALTGADLPEQPAKPIALILYQCFATVTALAWGIAIFMSLEPTP